MKRTLLCIAALLSVYAVTAQSYTSYAGRAIQFTGTATTRLESATNIAALKPLSAITIEAWVRASCCQSASNTIVSFGDGTNNSYVLSIGANGPQLTLLNGSSSVNVKRTVKYDQLETNRNYHIAATWSNATNTAVLYINGFRYYEINSLPSFTINYSGNGKLVVGATSDLSQPFNGGIDELRLWNAALSQSAIRSHINDTLTGGETGLVAYYRFNEAASATSAADASLTGASLTGISLTATNRITSFAAIPSRVPYYTSLIQNTNWDIQQTIADGVVWKYKIYDTLFDNKVSVNILDVDLAIADIDFRMPNLPTSTTASLAKMTTSEFMHKHGGIAAINGSYYMTSSPYGSGVFLRENGTTTFSTNKQHGVGYADVKALAFNNSNTAGIQIINRPQPNQNQNTNSFVSGWAGFTGFDNVMSSGPSLLTADTVSYDFIPMDTSHEGVSGRSAWSWHMTAYPFTAIGRTLNNHVILAVGDGKMASSGGPAGISCADLPYLMKALGCADAMKMDGGGSSEMTIEGKTYNDVVSYPSDNGTFDHEGERANVNAFVVVPKTKRGSGSALAFDGASTKVVIPDSVIGNPSGSFSVEGWARIDAGATNTDELINKNENTTTRKGYYIEYNNTTGKLVTGIAKTNNSWGSVTSSAAAWQAGQWHHFAMTYNSTTDSLKLYVDGLPTGSTYVNDPVFSTTSLCLGGSVYYTSNTLKGALDEVRIWSKELSAEEVLAGMHRNADVAAANLTAYYKMDDFYIGAVTDYSNHGKNGTATGGMTLYSIIASYAPIAGKNFDTLSNLKSNWWAYNSSSDAALTFYVPLATEAKYLLHGATTATGDTVAGIPAGISKRLNRKWLLDKTGTITETMSLSFNAAQLGVTNLDTTKEYYLLYAADGDNYKTVNPTPIYISGQTISFTSVEVKEGWYTIGYQPIQQSVTPGNYAYSFGGSTDVVKMSNFSNPAGNFSIEVWAKVNAGGSGDDELVNKNENASGRKGYFLEYGFSNSGTPGLKAGIAQTNGNWAMALYAAANWQPGQWHHVAMTYNAATKMLKLYQDGDEVASTTISVDTAVYSTRPFAIGGSDYYTGNGLNGAIDEVRVWDKELSATEIKNNMHQQVASTANALKAYYKLDVINTGSSVPDEVQNGIAGVASSSMSSSSVVVSYAPIEQTPVSGFVPGKANWYSRNKSFNTGLLITSAYSSEPVYVLHAANGQSGVVAYNGNQQRLGRVWHFHKKGIGQNVLSLSFVADSLGASMDSVQTVYLLRSDDNSLFASIDSVQVTSAADTFSFAIADTVSAYFSLGLKLTPSTPLDIKLLSFSAVPDNGDALLHWSVAAAANTRDYIVQRSADGKYFADVAALPSKGNIAEYEFTDKNITRYATDKLYYRLQIEELDGNSSYSPVAIVNIGDAKDLVSVTPNPFADKIVIKAVLQTDSKITVMLNNAIGANIINKSYTLSAGNQDIVLEQLSNIPAGVYELTISVNGKNNIQKMIKL